MSLKTQLTCIAAMALLLPWFALSYLQYLDSQFREGQEQILASEQARLLSEKFSADDWHTQLQQRSAMKNSLGAYPLGRDAQIDGFLHDWPTSQPPHSFAGLPIGKEVKFWLSEAPGGSLWLRIETQNLPFGWRTPQSEGFDEFLLEASSSGWRLRAGAEGAAEVDERVSAGQWRTSIQSEAVVRSSQNQTVIEWQLPSNIAEAPVQLSYYSHTLGYSVFALPGNGTLYPVRLSRELNIQSYLPGAVRVRLLDGNGWLYASSGEFAEAAHLPDINDSNSWARRFYLLWFNKVYPALPRLSFDVVDSKSCELSQWFRYQLAPVNRRCTQLDGGGRLIIDYRDESQFIMQARGLVYFLALSVLFALVLLLAFLGFGSLHSWRIRRLARLIASLKRGEAEAGKLKKSSVLSDEIDQLRHQFRDFYHSAEEQRAYLSALAPKLSHELKTPLAIISTSLDNLKAAEPDDTEVYAQRAQAGVKRLSMILHAMTSAQTFEQTLEGAERENIALKAFFESVCSAYQQIYAPQRIEYSMGGVDGVDEQWLMSPDLIAQMLDKLVSNACDFAAADSTIKINIQLVKHEAKRRWWSWRAVQCYRQLVVSVVNVGPPIPRGLQESLFDSLVTSRSSAKSEEGVHLGIGLYITRLICEWHAGTIAAFSEPLGHHLAKTSFVATLNELPLTTQK